MAIRGQNVKIFLGIGIMSLPLDSIKPMTLIHSTLAFFSLAMAILSMWVKRSPWIWGPFLLLAFALGYIAELITLIALSPIGGLLIIHILKNTLMI